MGIKARRTRVIGSHKDNPILVRCRGCLPHLLSSLPHQRKIGIRVIFPGNRSRILVDPNLLFMPAVISPITHSPKVVLLRLGIIDREHLRHHHIPSLRLLWATTIQTVCTRNHDRILELRRELLTEHHRLRLLQVPFRKIKTTEVLPFHNQDPIRKTLQAFLLLFLPTRFGAGS